MTIKVDKERARKKIERAKARARPELSTSSHYDEWRILNLYKKLDLDTATVVIKDTVPRVHVDQIDKKYFIETYEKPLIPVVLTGVIDQWPTRHRLSIDALAKKYRNEKFKCGEDDYGYNVRLKLKYFLHYMQTNCDDSPLYIFDGNFGEHIRKKKILDDYRPPYYFNEDLFKYVGDKRRPPYRWIVIGGPRSGTGIHIDPLGTSAWNALISGYKRWCLFPTRAPRQLVKLNPYVGGKQSSEAAQWFNMVYPKTQDSAWPSEFKPIEILQKPGETVFVPSGWWHVVLNLTDTVAITQNFVSTTNFPIVWHKTVRSRPKLSKKWLSELKVHRPDLYELTHSIDINTSTGITSDSSSGSSSSSSSSSSSASSSANSSASSCSCSSCEGSSEDSGQASLKDGKRKKRKRDSSSERSSQTYRRRRQDNTNR